MERPVGIDLFAGAGGMSLGFEQAGFDVSAAVELDPIHCAVHQFNFPKCAVVPKDISQVTAINVREAASLGRQAVDCVFGGPPCQGFSLIGHRVLDDPRNALVRDFVRLVAELGARTFVFENVKGLTVGRHRTFLEELVEEFDSAGYNVRLPWRVLDAASFGVPQRRERLILLGAKKGTRLPDYPASICAPADEPEEGLPPGPTCADALDDLPDVDQLAELACSDAVRLQRFGRGSRYALEMRCFSEEAWHRGYKRHWDPNVLTSSFRTQHSEISRRRFLETRQGEVEPISRFFRLQADGLSNTLRAGTDGARGAFTSPRPIHYKYPRCVTVREMARLHGFPDWFRMHATKWHGARQVGNAVAPPLARFIANQIVMVLGTSSDHPQGIMELGDEELLRMELSEAARYFRVAPPPSRRDRKSGARKRKQEETEAARLLARQASSNG